MMVDEEDEIITAGLLYEAHKAEQMLPISSAGVALSGKGKAKKREKGEEIVVTLVHGDVLRLYGDDFEVRDGTLFNTWEVPLTLFFLVAYSGR